MEIRWERDEENGNIKKYNTAMGIKNICMTLGSVFIAFSASAREPFNDISKFRINKEPARAFYLVYPNFGLAKDPIGVDDIENLYSSPSYKSLNGTWKFFFAKNRAEVKPEFLSKDFDASGWFDMDVPNSWQCRGFDRIFYDNHSLECFFDYGGKVYPEFVYGGSGKNRTMPEGAKDPFIHEDHRQAGVYRRNFTLPENWKGKTVFIKFDGVRTGFNLYVNGKFVGYSEDSFTPAEFDITKFLERGAANTVVAEVFKYTTGAFMEMQDMPHVAGIIRDVVLEARDNVHIKDYYAPTVLSADMKSADIDFFVKVQNRGAGESAARTLEGYLLDDAGNVVGGKPLFAQKVPAIASNSEAEIEAKVRLENFRLWSPDSPNLYAMAFRLLDADGRDGETVKADFGFRVMEIDSAKRQVKLNKKRFFFKGVNHHDWSPDKGKAMDFHWMKTDMLLMKRANMNCVRTSHYPKDDRFNMLCSRYGILVLDEANQEMHYFRKTPSACDLDIFVAPSVDRMCNMVMRDRNVPSVCIFSVGNESADHYAKALAAMADEGRKLSHLSGHFIHSEAEVNDIVDKRANGGSDFFSPMYGEIARMKEYLEKFTNETKPFFFCEYAHSMGNNLGGLFDCWRLIRSRDSLNGGFLWDWVDQGVYLPKNDGSGGKYISDGRDWNTLPSKGNNTMDGLIFADRTYAAKYFEAQRVYEDIQVSRVPNSADEYLISNEYISTNLDEFLPVVTVELNGQTIAYRYADPVSLSAGEKKTVKIFPPDFDGSAAGEYYLKIKFIRTRHTLFAAIGDTAAQTQFFMKKNELPEMPIGGSAPTYAENGDVVTVKAGGAEIAFSKAEAKMLSYSYNGVAMINSPVEFDTKSVYPDPFFRKSKTAFEKTGLAALKPKNADFKIEKFEDCLRLICSKDFDGAKGAGFKTRVVYTVLPNGFVNVSARCEKIGEIAKGVVIPRIGLRMGVDKKFDRARFFGRGPFANYEDRKSAADFGDYSLKVSDFFENYSRVQDSGNREGVRFFSLDDGNAGILISMPDSPNPVSVLPWTQAEMANAAHPYQLPKSVGTDLRIAFRVSGLGTSFSSPEPPYVIDFDKPATWRFTVMPFGSQGELERLRNARLGAKYDYKF